MHDSEPVQRLAAEPGPGFEVERLGGFEINREFDMVLLAEYPLLPPIPDSCTATKLGCASTRSSYPRINWR